MLYHAPESTNSRKPGALLPLITIKISYSGYPAPSSPDPLLLALSESSSTKQAAIILNKSTVRRSLRYSQRQTKLLSPSPKLWTPQKPRGKKRQWTGIETSGSWSPESEQEYEEEQQAKIEMYLEERIKEVEERELLVDAGVIRKNVKEQRCETLIRATQDIPINKEQRSLSSLVRAAVKNSFKSY